MAVYKVPQDVEADDKLIGPFSFRQFIYLVIVVIAIAIGWGLSRLFIGLAVIPLPIIVFFGALALPLRKDQPMEIYLAALVSFYLKPRKRTWDPDGLQSLVEVVARKNVEVQRIKDLSQLEAEQRLSYLAQIADSRGWAVRGAAAPAQNTAMNDDLYFEAQHTQDVLDTNSGVTVAFDNRLAQADAQRKQNMIARMHQPQPVQPTVDPVPARPQIHQESTPPSPLATQVVDQPLEPHLEFNPYPNAIHQSVISPVGDQRPASTTPVDKTVTPTPSKEEVSPDIINLANNSSLSIETIAHEAERIKKKEAELGDDEVVISLR